jgi:cytochrome o ubiquinol oxidase operon protein cyoD
MSDNHVNKAGATYGSVATYVTGFILSLVLTMTAYLMVENYGSSSSQPSHKYLLSAIMALALIQLFVQLIFFLHLDRESKPRWNLMVASFAVSVVLILVLGSLWIMNNLNYHMDAPAKTDKSIIKDEGAHY